MKEMDISDEMLSRFVEGTTDEADEKYILHSLEDDELSAEDLASIAEAAKLVDTAPKQIPNLFLAKRQIEDTLKNDNKKSAAPTSGRSKSRVYWAVAASIAMLLCVALFLLFRPDGSDQNFVQNGSDTSSVTITQPQQDGNLAQTTIQADNTPAKPQKTNDTEEETNVQEEGVIHSSQIIEKQYAGTKTANSLMVSKPSKDNYSVLCKNLDKAFQFEWSATNVQSLNFSVTNTQGKTIAQTSSISDNHYQLKYSDIYPEKKLYWTLEVVFKDGAREKRSGQIQIDYDL